MRCLQLCGGKQTIHVTLQRGGIRFRNYRIDPGFLYILRLDSVGIPGKQNDRHPVHSGTQLTSNPQAVHAWDSDIENNQVGMEVAGFFEGVDSVDSFATNLEPRLTLEEMAGCRAN